MGYFTRTRRTGLRLYLIAWAITFPVQTIVVFSSTDDDSNDYLYWVINAAILGAGIGLNLLGSKLRERRAQTV